MEKESNIEKVSGNLFTSLAATAVSVAATANPLVGFLPLLAATPAAIRHKKRVDATLEEISETLQHHDSLLRELSDSQYQFMAELVNVVLRTVDQKKLDYLKIAITKGAQAIAMTSEEATQLSRLLRDITADEAQFLVNHIDKKTVFIDFDKNIKKYEMCVRRGSEEHKLFMGLCTLGLAAFSQKHFEVDAYHFVDIAHDLVRLITTPP